MLLFISEKLKPDGNEVRTLRNEGMDRRRFLRRAAATAAWAAPAVATFSAAPAYAQACRDQQCGIAS